MMGDRHAFRANWHDYNDGIYFVTICCADKVHLFGKISNGEMHLSDLGTIASNCIKAIPNHYSNTEIWNYVIMPNHIHIVLSVTTPKSTIPVGARYIAPTSSIAHEPHIGCLKPPMHGDQCNDFHHNSQLANIVGSYKAAVTREYHRLMRARCIAPLPCLWQRLYHDYIIRNQRAFDNIMEYVSQNVERWDNDVFNQNN